MTALELLTVICAVLAMAAAATLSVLAARTLRVARELSAASQMFADEAIPAIEELKAAARRASGEVERIDDLLEVAGSIGNRVDTATEATYRALTSPLIKGVAFASGTRRAARRIRGVDVGAVGTNGTNGANGADVDARHALPASSVESQPKSGSRRHRRGVSSGRRVPLRGRTKG